VKAGPGSRRCTWISVFLGLLFLAQVEIPLGIKSSPAVNLIFAAGRILAAAGGIGFAIRALVLRRSDRQVGWIGPVTGLFLCNVHVVVALAMLALPALAKSGSEGVPWTHRSEAEHYAVTLPTALWRPVKIEGAASAFKCGVLGAKVGLFIDQESHEAYAGRVRTLQKDQLPKLKDGKSETGKTPGGHEYFLIEGFESGPEGDIQIKICAIYKPEQIQSIILICESAATMKSERGKAEQMAASEVAIRSICMSVK
jgi:hypothetical protein